MRPVIQPFAPPRSEIYRTAADIVMKLRRAGYDASLVGGCVRDLVLGRQPKDYDITTSAHPDEIQALFERSIPVGAAFGVITVVENGMNFEVATFREERDYMDAARAAHRARALPAAAREVRFVVGQRGRPCPHRAHPHLPRLTHPCGWRIPNKIEVIWLS